MINREALVRMIEVLCEVYPDAKEGVTAQIFNDLKLSDTDLHSTLDKFDRERRNSSLPWSPPRNLRNNTLRGFMMFLYEIPEEFRMREE